MIVSDFFSLFHGRRGKKREHYLLNSIECSDSWIPPSPYPFSQEKEIIFTNKLFPETNPLSWNTISSADTESQSRLKMLTHTLRKWHWGCKLCLWTGPCQLPRHVTRLRTGVTQDKSHTCSQAVASKVGVCNHGHTANSLYTVTKLQWNTSIKSIQKRGEFCAHDQSPGKQRAVIQYYIYTGSTNAWLFAKVWQICQNVKNYNFCVLKS